MAIIGIRGDSLPSLLAPYLNLFVIFVVIKWAEHFKKSKLLKLRAQLITFYEKEGVHCKVAKVYRENIGSLHVKIEALNKVFAHRATLSSFSPLINDAHWVLVPMLVR